MLSVLLLVFVVDWSLARAPMREIYCWRNFDWEFPNQEARNEAIRTGRYNPKDALPLGATRWRDRVFLATPRWRQGIPASLNTVPLNTSYSGVTSPLLRPYPDWSWHRNPERCEGIATVYRVAIDKMDRLWVADTGMVNGSKICPPQLLVFDLKTDRIILRERFPEDVLAGGAANIVNVVVDESEYDSQIFAYFADVARYAIIVYDVSRNRFWRIEHSYFLPDPLATDFNITGIEFQMLDGILGMALSPLRSDGERFLYFNPMASYRMFAVPTRILKNEEGLTDSSLDEFYYSPPKQSQSAPIAMDGDGTLFYGLLTHTSIGCWNWMNPFRQEFLSEIDRDPVSFQFTGDIKVDSDNNLWVITNRYPRFITGVIDWTDINYRVLYVPIRDAVRGTTCDRRNNSNICEGEKCQNPY